MFWCKSDCHPRNLCVWSVDLDCNVCMMLLKNRVISKLFRESVGLWINNATLFLKKRKRANFLISGDCLFSKAQPLAAAMQLGPVWAGPADLPRWCRQWPDSGLSLVHTDHVTLVLASDWSRLEDADSDWRPDTSLCCPVFTPWACL